MNTGTLRNGALALCAALALLAAGCEKGEQGQTPKTSVSKEKSATQPRPRARVNAAAEEQPGEKKYDEPAKKTTCNNCGVVLSIKEVVVEGKGTGVGAVAGGVTGAIIGNQVGQGTGNQLSTLAGAVGGAFAGNMVEKKMKKTTEYDVDVKLDTGEERVLRYQTLPPVVTGDKVRVEGDHVVRE